MEKTDEINELIDLYLGGEGFYVPSPTTIDVEVVLRVNLVRRIQISPTVYIFIITYPKDLDKYFKCHIFAHFLFYGERRPSRLDGYWNGTVIAKHEGIWVSRKYTPVFIDKEKREAHFCIRIYRPCEKFPDGGRLTRALDIVKPRDALVLNPFHAKYKLIRDGLVGTVTGDNFEFKTMNIVAGGTGITPFVRLMLYNKTIHVKLLFCNKRLEEILLKPLLDKIQERGLLEVRYLVTSEDPEIVQNFKPRNKDSITFAKLSQEYMENFFSPEDSYTFACGPAGMVTKVRQIASQLELRMVA
ncbi:NADH-cytochrome B5 [Babesia ovis]|uniref:NADH-cytochrome B5 n=1 Tax=Babesia ovis TaxID=5869 RepID=A0A9W5WVE5_BABOV|nr:NADH-cytochrome B5 [Babesia ovis]